MDFASFVQHLQPLPQLQECGAQTRFIKNYFSEPWSYRRRPWQISRRKVFSATRLLRCRSMASYTTPMPPWPSLRRISKRVLVGAPRTAVAVWLSRADRGDSLAVRSSGVAGAQARSESAERQSAQV